MKIYEKLKGAKPFVAYESIGMKVDFKRIYFLMISKLPIFAVWKCDYDFIKKHLR